MQLTKYNFPVMYTACKRKINWTMFISLRPEQMIFVKVINNDNSVEFVRVDLGEFPTLRDVSMFCSGLDFAGVKVEREDFIIG